jgi:hypothetical protein
MKLFHVEIKGTKSLLMHSSESMLKPKPRGGRTVKKSPEDEAENGAYRDAEGYLVIPALNVMACLIKAARKVKLARGSGFGMPEVIKGSVTIEPDRPRLLNGKGETIKDYEILATTVVNPSTHGRMPSYRPEVKEWGLRYDIRWNDLVYPIDAPLIKDVVNQSRYEGLGDWRPMHGAFEVVSIEAEDV